MWRTLVITVLCSVAVSCLNIQFTGKEIDPDLDLEYDEAISLDLHEQNVEMENIRHRIHLKSDMIIDDIPDNLKLKYHTSEEDSAEEEDPAFQPWSILWYIGSFGGLIAFFLVVSCSEWCCRNHGRNQSSRNSACSSPTPSEAPPPAYDLFAPPSYESLCTNANGEKSDYDVFVVPVHAMESMTENRGLQIDEPSAPPAYFAHSTSVRMENAPHNEVVLNVARAEDEHRERHKVQRESSTQT